MPVLAATGERIIPKSALRHRPIGEGSSPGKKGSEKTVSQPPVAQRASRMHTADVADEVTEWKTASRKTVPTQSSKPLDSQESQTTPKIRTTSKIPFRPGSKTRLKWKSMPLSRVRRAHPLFYLGLGMLGMLVLWMMLSSLVNWVVVTMDDLHYGRPRTFHTDAWVGHNEQTGVRSHFIAINLNKRIQIIEIAGGDPAQTRIYSGPQLFGADDDLVPVTLRFVDVNGDHKPDMLVQFQGSRMVFINDQDKFRPLQSSERPQVEQFLQKLGT